MDEARNTAHLNPSDQPAPAKMFPQWREVEQDFWVDMFEQFSDTMLNQIPEEEADLQKQIEKAGGQDNFYTEKIKLAALLADEATKEMIYRFHRQKPIPKQRRPTEDRAKKKTRRLW